MRRAWLAFALALVAGACGYSAGLRVAAEHDSVGVELFGNESLERDLEPLLHDQLTRVLRDQSDARLVEPRDAQAVIRGTIRSYHRRGGIRDADNHLLETGVFIEIEARLERPGTEAPLRSTTVGTWVGYTLDQPVNERDARDRVLRHLAEQIVLELLGPAGPD